MTEPRIELIPARHAVCSDQSVVLDVLIRITPPQPDVHFPRVPLNLALVLDRSGSMSEGKKMAFAREAASFAVTQLLPTDRVSVTVFDNFVDTIVAGGPAINKPTLVRRIEQIQPRGSTDLHGGWVEGGRQAAAGLKSGGINRVLLLSDGLANVGVVDPNTIATEVAGLAARDVGTTTMGVGDNYNEDLLEAMAHAGDGRYYYIKSPVQLVDIFQTELQGLMDTLGQKVSLGVGPMNGVAVSDVLNDLEKTANGNLMLPNIVVGMPLMVVIQLKLPPISASVSLLEIRVAWDCARNGDRRVLHATLGELPVLPMSEWAAAAENPEVSEQVALLMVARAQKEAASAAERGDYRQTRGALARAAYLLKAAPATAEVRSETQGTCNLIAAFDAGETDAFVKEAKFRSYGRRQSRTQKPPAGELSTES